MEGQDTLFDLSLGEKAKERGMFSAGAADRAWSWKQDALDTIYELAASGQPFTADDVVGLVGLPSYGTNRNNAVGAVFSAAAKRGWIVPTGAYRKSRRAMSHARVITVWSGHPGWDF